jgi:hypothetical protein
LALLLAHVALNGPVTRYRFVIEPLTNVLALGGVWSLLGRAAGRLVAPAGGRRCLASALARDASERRQAAGSAAGQTVAEG